MNLVKLNDKKTIEKCEFLTNRLLFKNTKWTKSWPQKLGKKLFLKFEILSCEK